MSAERIYTWTDDAQLIVWPPEHPSPAFGGGLAACVRKAIAIADGQPPPVRVEISHVSPGLIQLDEIRRMAADPTFPSEEEVDIHELKLGPMS